MSKDVESNLTRWFFYTQVYEEPAWYPTAAMIDWLFAPQLDGTSFRSFVRRRMTNQMSMNF